MSETPSPLSEAAEPPPSPPPSDRARTPWDPRSKVSVATWPWLAWAGVCLAAIVFLERFRAPNTFHFDEWDFVFHRRSGGLDDLLRPHNGHLSVLPVIAYRVGFALFGLDRYGAFRLMGLLVHASVATAVFAYVHSRLGSLAALTAGLLVMLLGSGWQNIFWPFQIGFMGSIAAGIIAWIALDRKSPRSTMFASVALGVALACSGLGISIVAGATARLAFERCWHRLARVVVPPVALYAIWYVLYGQSQGSSDNITRIPRFVVDSLSGSVGGLGGRDLLWGRLLTGVLIGAMIALVCVHRRLPTTIVAPAVCALANWALTGYSRADMSDPGSSRYVYVGAVLVLLVLADFLAPLSRPLLGQLAACAALLGVWGNWALLHAGSSGLRETTAVTRSELRAVEWAAGRVDPAYRPDDQRMPQVSSGPYLLLIDELGSPAASDGEVAVATAKARAEVDRVSLQALQFAISPAVGDPGDFELPLESDTSTVQEEPNGCFTVLLAPDGIAVATVTLPEGSPVMVSSLSYPVELRLRRYADTFPTAPAARIDGLTAATVQVPADGAPLTDWVVELRSTGEIKLCGLTA